MNFGKKDIAKKNFFEVLTKRQEFIKQINEAKWDMEQLEGSPNTVIGRGKHYREKSLRSVFDFALNNLLTDSLSLTAIYDDQSQAEALTLIEELDRFC